MADIDIRRRVQRIRWGAYAAYCLIAGVLAAGAAPRWPMLAAGVALAFVALAATLLSSRDLRLGLGFENVATPLLLGLADVPALPCLAAAAALLLGTLALRGFRAAGPASLTITLGWFAGRSAGIEVAHAHTVAGDVLAVVFLVVYGALLAAYGYEETIRQHRERQAARARSALLERDRATLVRYLPDDLPRRLDAGATLPERRWLSIAAVDLEGFTANLERLAPEDLVTVLDDVYGLFADAAAQHGGVLHKFLGDGALICFGAAADRGRRAEAAQCVALARALPQHLAGLNDRWRSFGIPASFAVRAGVASGFCTLGSIGRGHRSDFTVVGLPVNLATRLENLAPRGRALVDAATADLVEACLGEGRPTPVRGFAQPVVVHLA